MRISELSFLGSFRQDPSTIPISWASFVDLVLRLTVGAYQVMCTEGNAQRSWHEDTFTFNLVRYIRSYAELHCPLSLNVTNQATVEKDGMKSGALQLKEASKIDIKIHTWSQNYVTTYFSWECKRICTRQTNANLIAKYVSEGLIRYINGDYSSNLSDGGMIGYVLDGDIPSIVSEINESMLNKRRKHTLSVSDHLAAAEPVDSFHDVYESSHTRANSSINIRVFHLFLSFDLSKN